MKDKHQVPGLEYVALLNSAMIQSDDVSTSVINNMTKKNTPFAKL